MDDAHLLDDLSAFVVHQLVHRRLAKVIVTLRNREPARRDHRLVGLLPRRIELPALTPAESAHLLTRVLEAHAGSCYCPTPLGSNRGNALFLRHFVDQGWPAGTCVTTTGRGHGPVTRSVHQPGRAGRLDGCASDPLADVVDLLTVAGPLDCDLLAEIVGFPAVDEARRGAFTDDTTPTGRGTAWPPAARRGSPVEGQRYAGATTRGRVVQS